MPSIYYLCPDHDNQPTGGVKQIYRHVDILNRHGYSAFVLHSQEGFRATWFDNNTKIVYQSAVSLCARDCLVLPEVLGPSISKVKGIRKVILNQNAYNSFRGYSFDKNDLQSPYLEEDVLAVLVPSEDSRRYLKYVFPQLTVVRIHEGIDPKIHLFSADKKKQIAYIPRKLPEEARQAVNILKFRRVLDDFDLVPIANVTEKDLAKIYRESLIFLSFSHAEGCQLPPQEAMLCGCLVIGYHGRGGKEYFKPEFCFPVEEGDIIGFAQTVERVIRQYRGKHRALLMEKAQKASRYISRVASLEREESDIINFWRTYGGKDILPHGTRPIHS